MSRIIITFLHVFITTVLVAQREYPPCEAYISRDYDTILITRSYSNTLYVGIDNIVKVNKKVIKFPVELATDNGEIFPEDDFYYLIPYKVAPTTLTLYKKGDKKTLVGKFTYQVKSLPPPQVSMCDLLIDKVSEIDKRFLLNCNTIKAYYSDDLVNANEWLEITRYSIGYTYGNYYIEFFSPTNTMTDEMKDAIVKMPNGSRLNINLTCKSQGNIKIVLPTIQIMVY